MRFLIDFLILCASGLLSISNFFNRCGAFFIRCGQYLCDRYKPQK